MRVVYSLLLLLLAPFAFAWLGVRSRRQTGAADPWRERCGHVAIDAAVPVIWVHAASLGEVQSARALVEALLARDAASPLLITTFTATGRRRAQALFGDRATVAALPYDLPLFVNRFVRAARPAIGIVIETEIWPNLFRALARHGTPIVMVSARLSPRAFRRYRRWRAFVAASLRPVAQVGAQTAQDRERFLALGVEPSRVSVVGNLKFDSPAPAVDGCRLRQSLFGERRVWVAGSTRPGEEEMLLAAFASVREMVPDCVLVLAPRHPERAEAVARLARAQGLETALRSGCRERRCTGDVMVVDGVGELTEFYAAADVVFVGGTLVDIGGHNILEPAALARPIVTGPHLHNWRELATELVSQGGLSVAHDAREVALTTGAWLRDPAARKAAGAAAQAAVAANRGALARVIGLVDATLPPPSM